MKRKLMAIFLSTLMLFAMLPLGALSVSAEITSGTTGDCTWTLDDDRCVLTISGNGRMADYDSASDRPWRNGEYRVIIEEGVTYIGENAFTRCYFWSLTLPKSVTVVADNAFGSALECLYACIDYAGTKNDRNKIVVGNNNYVLEDIRWTYNEIEQGTTGDCTWTLEEGHLIISGYGAMKDDYSPWGRGVTKVTIRYGVTYIGNSAFENCDSLENVTVPESVTSIGSYAFAGCELLLNVTLIEGVATIGEGAFEYCYNLSRIEFPRSLTTIGDGAFSATGYSMEVSYDGSIVDYYNMEIGIDNEDLLDAEWSYNGSIQSTYSYEVAHSVMDTENGNGLAFRFELNANDIAVKNGSEVDLTNATIRYGKYDYKLVAMGVVMSNRYSYPDLYDVNGVNTLNVPVVYLQEVDEDSCTFAARIINIPDEQLKRTIYARPYYVIEVDGEEFTVYGSTDRATCAQYM